MSWQLEGGAGAVNEAGRMRMQAYRMALNPLGQDLTDEELRQRACRGPLRQAAIADGLLDSADPAPGDGAISAAASETIEALLERELQLLEPSDDACRRYHAAHPARYRSGERTYVAAMRQVLQLLAGRADIEGVELDSCDTPLVQRPNGRRRR
jgi:peptidyl-prolyl cis-trans isomerase C